MNPAPIGIFDSGIGGLTVARAIYDRLPGESTIYYGDTARVPYGPKSPDTVRRYSLEILHWLLGEGVKAVVIACHTSTAHALDALRAASPVPVVGVIEPGARAAVAAAAVAAPEGRRVVGVIGTAGTIHSNAYGRAIHALDASIRVEQQACPLFGAWWRRAGSTIRRRRSSPMNTCGRCAMPASRSWCWAAPTTRC